MAGYIVHGEERNVVIPAAQADALVKSGSGDAALLFLALQRTDGAVTPEKLCEKTGLSRLRLDAAELVLADMGLIAQPRDRRPVQEEEERLTYSTEDVAQLLETDAGFSALVSQVQEKLGKKLKTLDLQMLAGLYDDAGLPPDVIYLLVCHCIERCERRYGPGRRPTMHQIEKEGFLWAKRGLMDQESADRYLRDYAARLGAMAPYLHVLQIENRRTAEVESRYVQEWIDQGFPPETVSLAYEKTLTYRGELNWRYLNGILRRWHEAGLHTPEEVARGDRYPEKTGGGKSGGKTGSQKTEDASKEWIRRYAKK